jgi:glycosyltransferase involved in cell wall biosynthesis
MAKKNTKSKFPFVSVCTPTFNRRPFFPSLIKCLKSQSYPADRIEWIIIDDGTDKIEDLVSYLPQVKYFKYDEKMYLGKKRNLMHEKCSGDIIIYMDDDDYYPPQRISHAVEVLTMNPQAMCAGTSEMNIYFKHIQTMYQFGPYNQNHATAASFAFRKQLLKETRYDDTAAVAEEKLFLKNYTIPFVQLDVTKTILVFSHIHNSLDKKILLESPNKYINVSQRTVDDYIKDDELKQFYMVDIDNILSTYEPGRPEHKPEVLKQIEDMTEDRKRRLEEFQEKNSVSRMEHEKMKEHYEKIIQSKEYLISELFRQHKAMREKLTNYILKETEKEKEQTHN